MFDSAATTLNDIKVLSFPHLGNDETWINVYQCPSPVPFTIARVFNVYSKTPSRRGRHAHRKCSQLIVCVTGKVKLDVNDGQKCRPIDLNSGDQGVFVPPGLWVEVEYLDVNSAIMVLCDLAYDESEYIRSWDDFIKYKGLK